MDNILRNAGCDRCSLCAGTKHVCQMPSQLIEKDIMIIGDYPSYYNGQEGGGYSNPLVNGIIKEAISAETDEFYMTHLIKCRPPERVVPTTKQYDACLPYLMAEIATVKPRAILLISGNVVKRLLDIDDPITKIRGQEIKKSFWNDENGQPVETTVIPTYSPAYVDQNQAELKNFAKDIYKAYVIGHQIEEKKQEIKITMVKTIEAFDEMLDNIELSGRAAFDYETTGLDYWATEFRNTCITFTIAPGTAYYLPLRHKEPIYDPQNPKKITGFQQQHWSEPDLAYIIDKLGTRFFGNPKIRKIAHNLKFDIHCSRQMGIETFRGRFDDTMLMHSLLYSGADHGLKPVATGYYPEFEGYEDVVKKIGFDKCPERILAPYGCTDTALTYQLCVILEAELLKDERMYTNYRNLQMPLLWPLEDAEFGGVLIDEVLGAEYVKETERMADMMEDKLRSYRQVRTFDMVERENSKYQELLDLDKEYAEISVAQKEAGKEDVLTMRQKNIEKVKADIKAGTRVTYDKVNFGSAPQLSKLFYEGHGFGFKKKKDPKTKQEMSGTGKEVVIDIEDDTGFILDLQKWRSIKKMQSTYLTGILKRLDKNGYLHAEFNQHTVITGRLSSSNPNLQNIPNKDKVKDEETRRIVGFIKALFSVPEGFDFVAGDFSQAELRVIAQFAMDEAMLAVFRNNQDIHTITAAKANKMTLEELMALDEKVWKVMRSKAKPVNFGFVYGMSADGFVDYARLQYGVIFTKEEAKEIRDNYFKGYPRLLEYHALYKKKAHKFGGVRTLFGRFIQLADINSPVPRIQSEAERLAINGPIQGTSGEWANFSIAMLWHRLDRSVRFKINVHDALYYYAPQSIRDASLPIIKDTCENLPVMKYFGRDMPDVQMKLDMEISSKGWKDLEAVTVA